MRREDEAEKNRVAEEKEKQRLEAIKFEKEVKSRIAQEAKEYAAENARL